MTVILAAEFLVLLLNRLRVLRQPRILAAADVHERHAGLGQGGQAIGQRRRLGHVAPHDRVLGVDARDLVRVAEGPRVHLAGRAAGALHDGFLGVAVIGHVFIDGVPLAAVRPVAVVADGADDDHKALGQQALVDHRVAVHKARPEDPRLARGLLLRHDDRDGHLVAQPRVVAVVALREERPAAGDVVLLGRELPVRALEAVIGEVR